jgi:sulfide:quinone oxidoreductase|mmetsp:Transcript_37409/g.49174  ORF Transcript_37409/g.49174 Transcript_37409/m.49174 type:complete len:415 (+) Transcript_37409:269-1513(+)
MVWVQPQAYFGILHQHIKALKMETGTLSAMIDTWSKIENTKVTKLDPSGNQVTLANGKTLSYKALVLGAGFDHSAEFVPGLAEFEEGPDTNNVFVHQLNDKRRLERNFYNGAIHQGGDYINYSPAVPYKGEGSDFYSLYYESLLRTDKMMGTAAAGAKVQYWSPNKFIYNFPYANEVAMEECEKRGVELYLGWELQSVREDAHSKVAVFKNVDSGETIEKDFVGANINPPSRQHQFLLDSGVCDSTGMVDVNRYTLQHRKFENIFAIGDCITGETTRTYTGAIQQNPVVKHNLLQYLEGRECNAIYDGYQYMPFYLGTSYGAGFSHLHDFEPASTNDSVPHYGVFSNLYFNYMMSNQQKMGEKYTSFAKNQGPPHYHYAARFDELEHNEYLQQRQIPLEEVVHPNAQRRISTAQ